jgi:hypothetical protein
VVVVLLLQAKLFPLSYAWVSYDALGLASAEKPIFRLRIHHTPSSPDSDSGPVAIHQGKLFRRYRRLERIGFFARCSQPDARLFRRLFDLTNGIQ